MIWANLKGLSDELRIHSWNEHMSLPWVSCRRKSRVRCSLAEDTPSWPHGVVRPRRKSPEFFCNDAKPRDYLHRSATGLLPLLREELRQRFAVQSDMCAAPERLHVEWLLGEQGDRTPMRNHQTIARNHQGA